jgi:VWFA-related protein
MDRKPLAFILAFSLAAPLGAQRATPPEEDQQGFTFKSGVELVNVTATVTDSAGHFVEGLAKDDFRVFEDDVLQTVTHFGADRVPVSLGVVLDASGSMDGEKIRSARSALEQFLLELDDPQDEFFLYQFNEIPILLEGWTSDRRAISRALARVSPDGGTALYDAVARAVPLAASGRNAKKALLVISDGNEVSSHISLDKLSQAVRASEVMIYAIGIDGSSESSTPSTRPPSYPQPVPQWPQPTPRYPQPAPPRPGGFLKSGQFQWPFPPMPRSMGGTRQDERVNPGPLRRITDVTGGRTEIIRSASDLRPATSGIADELSKQYYLGYSSTGKKDGKWHTIRVDVGKNYRVRARQGFVAS